VGTLILSVAVGLHNFLTGIASEFISAQVRGVVKLTSSAIRLVDRA